MHTGDAKCVTEILGRGKNKEVRVDKTLNVLMLMSKML